MTHEFTNPLGADLEQLAGQLDRAMAKLDQTERRFADHQIISGETVFRDPKDAYHQITIGAVLTAHTITAHDARALDGLLALPLAEFGRLLANLQRMRANEPDLEVGESVGSFLLTILGLWGSELEQEGRYAEWRRSFDRYMTTTEMFLENMTADDLEKLSQRPPSRKQVSLIRTTCEYLRLDFPVLANRAQAFEWLRDVGANNHYRERR